MRRRAGRTPDPPPPTPISETDLAELERKSPKGPDAIEQPVVDYVTLDTSPERPDGNIDWRVSRWELIKADIPELEAEDLPHFHNLIRERDRWWFILRRLYGFMPRQVVIDANPDDYRQWTRDEMAAHWGITRAQFDSETQGIRAAWRKFLRLRQASVRSTKPTKLNQKKEEGQQPSETKIDEEAIDEYLIRFSVDPMIFHLPARGSEENLVEKAWFAKRLKEWEPLLTKSTMTERLALDTIHNELRLRREQAALWKIEREITPADFKRRNQLEERKGRQSDRVKELQELHGQQLEQITEHAPWFNVTEGQVSATGAVSQIVQGIQEFYAFEDTTILDAIFTGAELQVLMRTSKQNDEPRYRPGWVFYVNESRKWLWDPKAKPWMQPRDLAKWDNAFKEAVKKFNETSDEKVVDLESDDKDGEYADLYVPPKTP